ncbi:MAG: universal stress protein [Rhodopirellula sp.]|nr:universal stress protein [Rhodopirellula sp.]
MKILHAADDSPHAENAERLLNRFPFPDGTEMIVAHVVEEFYVSAFGENIGQYVHEAMHDEHIVHANSLLKLSASRLSGHFKTVREQLLAGHAAHEITKLAAAEQVDLVSIGARGMNGLERFLLGSTSEKVLLQAPCSVLVAHRPTRARDIGPVPDRLRLLVVFDGSPASNEAVETLAHYPLGDSVEIVLLYVHSLVTSFRADILQRCSQQWKEEESVARAALDKAARRLESTGVSNVGVAVHEAADVTAEILKVGESWNADIILAGDTGKSSVDRFLMGSVCKRLTRHAHCGVWVVRQKRMTDE